MQQLVGRRIVSSSSSSSSHLVSQQAGTSHISPVSYNRAAGVESKISKLKAQKAVLEDMASLIGVRADDIEWVIEQSDFDLLTQKEEARKLMLPTQAERDSDDTSWVNPTRAKLEVSRASDLLSKGKKYF